jgi:hypothetical protein
MFLIGQKEDRVWGVAYQIGNVVFALHYYLLLVVPVLSSVADP